MTARIAIVVLNWNNAQDTLACLASLKRLTYPHYEILVVDNGSTDDSVLKIRTAYPCVQIIETGTNLGYAGGNNVGIRYALKNGAEFVCILNNDIVVDSSFLETLLTTLQTNPMIGIVTPLIVAATDPDHVWALGAMLDQRTGAIKRHHVGDEISCVQSIPPFSVDVTPGSAMLARREVFAEAGLLNETYFLYFEEADWSMCVAKSGYCIVAVPQSIVWHKVSATLGITSPLVDYYMQRNYLLFIARHWTGFGRMLLLLRAVVRACCTIAVFTIKSDNRQRLPNRNARLLALRDALLGRWGKISSDVVAICRPSRHRRKLINY